MIVLDASALIALVNDEVGADIVGQAVTDDDATISTVNYSEALHKAARTNVAPEVLDAPIEGLGITVSPFSRLDARLTPSSTGTAPDSAWPTVSVSPSLAA